MAKFHVFVPEVHYQTVEIEAETVEAAAKAVYDGNGTVIDGALQFGYGLDVTELRVLNTDTGTDQNIDVFPMEDEEDNT